MRGVEALAHQAREQVALLARGLAAHERAGALARARQAGGGLRERALPGDGPQLAAVAQQRLGHARAGGSARSRRPARGRPPSAG